MDVYEEIAQPYDALATQTPVLNAAKDEATYHITFSNSDNAEPLVFVKINGKWYMNPTSTN